MILFGIVILLILLCVVIVECACHPVVSVNLLMGETSKSSGILGGSASKPKEQKEVIKIKDHDTELELENHKKVIELFEGKSLKPIYTYDELPKLKFQSTDTNYKFACHSGQRKLLLTEIEFLTYVGPKIPDLKLVIYAGSAPCEHVSVLLSLFPNLKFLFIDPNYHGIIEKYKYVYQNLESISKDNHKKFVNDIEKKDKNRYFGRRFQHAKGLLGVDFIDPSLKNVDVLKSKAEFIDKKNTITNKEIMKNHQAFKTKGHKTLIKSLLDDDTRIYIIQDYMSKDLSILIAESLKLAGYPSNVFISDIRTNMFNPDGPLDIDIIWNDALQMIFLKTIRPDYSMLKYHPPLHYDTDNSVEMHSNSEIIKGDLDYVKKEYGADPVGEYSNGKYPYLPCETIFLQAWATTSGTESRLIISKKNLDEPLVNYDYLEWLDKYYYFRRMRGLAYYGDLYEKIKDFIVFY